MIEWIAFSLLVGVLVVAAIMDLRTGKVDNRLTYCAMVVGLIFWTTAGLFMEKSFLGTWQAGIGLAAGLIPFTLLFAMGGLGGGDVKLMGAVGALGASWQIVLSTTLYAFAVAVVIAIVMMVRHRIIKRTLMRILGAAILASTQTKPEFPEDSPRVPFALAIAVGGLVAGMEHLLHVPMPFNF